MVKVLAISLDGYSGWTSSFEEEIELPVFTVEAICQQIADEDEDEDEDMSDIRDGFTDISISPNTIILNGEEGGCVYVKMS